MNDWTKALDADHSVEFLYFDFAKAIDSVSHNCLISKLRSCGRYIWKPSWVGQELSCWEETEGCFELL